ncbi:hypothetical protein D7Y13_40940 [Corallococcus praedator]|uniref:Lipoprotein n=1 Tax=Corallococcus praedator TaxID=2316724 RepID=A0ABX9Q3Q7_9BACT|nr:MULTISPECIES: hypothetical protein [Corallococcus]RKH30859.1 hypothetical protein D7X75_20560 [Corallococcus sp. CA031C]RKH89147.1 hypothetical protein D7Y13_40940 [Corallococcus praedator]
MMLRTVVLVLGLVGCARRPEPLSAPVLDDRTVHFPVPTGADVIRVGAAGVPAVLDGETLRALMIVSRDLFPLGSAASTCDSRPESFTYRVLRQGGLLFVYVDEEPSACGRRFPTLDSGAKYALRADGRILRRVVDGVDADDELRGGVLPDGGVGTVLVPPTMGALPMDGGLPAVSREDAVAPDAGLLSPVGR